MLGIYRIATDLGGPAINLILARRQARGKEDAARLAERRGVGGRARPKGRLVWVHGASVGESLSALPLIERLLGDNADLHILVTTGTVTSAALMADRLPARAFHQYVPVDRAAWVRRFLDHWRPDAALWMESEFWPNLMSDTAARDIPMILVNGRVSDRSHRGWSRRPRTIKKLLSRFALCLGQSEADRDRLKALGATAPLYFGNLKFAAPPLPGDKNVLAQLKKGIGRRPLWLASSTHPGEEEMVIEAHGRLALDRDDLLTVLVPRHPDRGDEVATLLDTAGFEYARRSRGDQIDAKTRIYLADTLGELGLFYRLADIVFVGGSLVLNGGHNLIEPAQLGCAILHGPHMENFKDMAAEMQAAKAAAEVTSAKTLAKAIERLLSDEAQRDALAAAAQAVARSKQGVLDDIVDAMISHVPFLMKVRKPARRPKGKPRARA